MRPGEPPACDAIDPATAADFRVMLDAWPDQSPYEAAIDRICVIDSVDVDPDLIVTQITCDVDGTPRAATIEIPAAPEGDGIRRTTVWCLP